MKLKLISDGTNTGTKLIDTDTGEQVKGIQKITYDLDCTNIPKVTVELFNVPVEIVAKEASVSLLKYSLVENEFMPNVSFEKNIKVVTKEAAQNRCLSSYDHMMYDADSNNVIGAVQSVKWVATPDKIDAEVVKIFYDNKEWE